MNDELRQAEAKKAYESPRLTNISLRPEEAVLGACKVLGHSATNIMAICGFGCPNAGS